MLDQYTQSIQNDTQQSLFVPTQQHFLQTLRHQFGFEHFRPGQLEAITELFRANSLLCIHPTGFGKSLLYQLPSVMLNGITLVISPLLALMRDQIRQLNHRFKIAAGALNTDQTEEENSNAIYLARNGHLKILFVAPEQLDNLERFNFLMNLNLSLVVVDEAHCISTWGHDFRPSYRQIIHFVKSTQQKNSQIKILGLTATADARTEKDIMQQFSIGRPVSVLRESMNRPNISLSVLPVRTIARKLIACEQLINKLEGSGLIYCATRENTELLANYLKMRGFNADGYHAGFLPEEKRQLQEAFLEDKYKVLCATNALGMGIDKPNLRFIIHFDFPGSITAYYQEVGRSGRDGKSAHGILLYDENDKKIQQHFIESSQPALEDFDLVISIIRNAVDGIGLMNIKSTSGLHPTRVTVILAELVEQNYVIKFQMHGKQLYALNPSVGNGRKLDLSRYSIQYSNKMRELDAMMHYSIQKTDCRMEILRSSLGDVKTQKCGHCCTCGKPHFEYIDDPLRTSEVQAWLNLNGVEIPSTKIPMMSAGLALLDIKLRLPLSYHFMQHRATSSFQNLGLAEELIVLLKKNLSKIAAKNNICCVVAIPSRTWGAKDGVAAFIGNFLGVPVYVDWLKWIEIPKHRQGELSNNDQRHQNVHLKMGAYGNRPLKAGSILLLDDYIGSGNTFKEAVRALRKDAGVKQDIIPFTIAAVKWRLGAPGMI